MTGRLVWPKKNSRREFLFSKFGKILLTIHVLVAGCSGEAVDFKTAEGAIRDSVEQGIFASSAASAALPSTVLAVTVRSCLPVGPEVAECVADVAITVKGHSRPTTTTAAFIVKKTADKWHAKPVTP